MVMVLVQHHPAHSGAPPQRGIYAALAGSTLAVVKLLEYKGAESIKSTLLTKATYNENE